MTDLEDIEVKVDDDDLAILVHNALTPPHKNFLETMKVSKESLSLDDVVIALKSKHIDDSKATERKERSHAREKGSLTASLAQKIIRRHRTKVENQRS